MEWRVSGMCWPLRDRTGGACDDEGRKYEKYNY